jgi:hypothetical protein
LEEARELNSTPVSEENPTAERVLGRIEVGKRLVTRRLGLYFTQKRLIVAQTGLSNLWLALMIVSILLGLFLFLVAILMLGLYTFTGKMLEIFYGDLSILDIVFDTVTGNLTLIPIAIIFMVAPRLLATRAMRKRFEKFNGLSPENILKTGKKNFEISYEEIERVEIIEARGRGAFGSSKIRILSNGEKIEFWLVRVVGKYGYEGKPERAKLAEYENFVRSILPNKTFVLPKWKP